MAQTTIAVDVNTREALRALSARMRTTSMDEAVKALIWEHECMESLDRLEDDPAAAAEYQIETDMWAELDVQVVE